MTSKRLSSLKTEMIDNILCWKLKKKVMQKKKVSLELLHTFLTKFIDNKWTINSA